MREHKVKIRIIRNRRRLGAKKKTAKRIFPTFYFLKSVRSFAARFIVLALFVGMNWYGLWVVGTTIAYYNDTETSAGNGFTTDFLDFSLSESSFEKTITLDETVSKSTVLVNSGGMDFQYTLEAEEVADEDNFCGALNLQAKLNGVEQYDGDLMSLVTSPVATLGTWKFNIELPVDETSFTNGSECQFDVVFKGWQTNVGAYEDGGFNDEERMSFTITVGKMVVLNEFLPNPDGIAYDFDFGSDSDDMPQGEWVELYNNSDSSHDLSGWYVWDASNDEGNKVEITSLNTVPAGTIIGGKSWLVVYMNKAIFNNTGDTVKLFDDSDTLIDSHTYTGDPDYCEIEPTPGDENSTTTTGDCGGVPPNKSYARIPDGIGEWVDPIPTPGGSNRLVGIEDDAAVSIPEIEVLPPIAPEVFVVEESLDLLEESVVEESVVEESVVEEVEGVIIVEEAVVVEEIVVAEEVIAELPQDDEDDALAPAILEEELEVVTGGGEGEIQ